MDRVDEIKRQLAELEEQRKQLQQELQAIQAECVHQYRELGMVKVCSRCQRAESLYY